MSLTPGTKITLRLPNGTPKRLSEQLTTTSLKIKRNLVPLKQNTKKKDAQTIYYRKHPEYQSPLIKQEKGPVHQRLGQKSLMPQIRLKRLVPLGTNTSSVLPKKTMFKPTNFHNLHSIRRNTGGQMKQLKLQRMYSAQSRLERIRRQQQNGTIKLKRHNAMLPPATNLTVQVNNPNYIPTNNCSAYSMDNQITKFKMVLNDQIQTEILEIQAENIGASNPLPPQTRITPATTGIPTTIRFFNYSN